MAKRGHEINLASGAMFSPAQEHARMQKMRIILARDLTLQHMETLGFRVEYFKRPSMVHEFHFYLGDERVARRSLDNDMIRKGGRQAAGHMMESVCIDEGISFDWNDLPDQAEPVERIIVDNVGGPPENAPRRPHTPADPPAHQPESPTEPDAPDMLAVHEWSEDWTIRELKDWATAHGTPVPSEITRKGDILEFLVNEYSD